MDLILRDLRTGDRSALERILLASAAFSAEEVAVALELIDLGEEPVADGYRFVVAERGGAVAGYACYGLVPLSDGCYDLYWIAVDPGLHGRGIGRRLMAAVEERLVRQGARWLLIETAGKPEYEATRAFYAKVCYQEVARIPDFYRLGDDKIVYGKRLDRRP